MQVVLIPGRRTALCLALAAFTSYPGALDLGPAQVHSALGEKLDATITLKSRAGEWFHASCLALTRDPTQPGVAFLADGSVSVERRRNRSDLRVRTATPVSEPAIAFGITSTCAGAAQSLPGSVVLLLDPPRAGTATKPRADRPGPMPSVTAPAQPAVPKRATIAASPPAESRDRAVPAPAAPAPSDPAATPTSAKRPARDAQFVLRLSSDSMDMARTRQFDDKARAVLRERLRLLDHDDQVAAMLSMRDNLKRLEARVAELQLKLATMPPDFARDSAPVQGTNPATTVASAPQRIEPPAPKAPAPIVEAPAPRQEAVRPAIQAPVPAREPDSTNTQASQASEAAALAKPDAPVPKVEASGSGLSAQSILGALESLQGRLIGAGLALLLLLAIAARMWMRGRSTAADEQSEHEGEATVLMAPDHTVIADSAGLAGEEPIEIAPPPAPAARVEMASDASLATRLQDNTEGLRRRYIEERFPEIRSGTIVLDDPSSVVKGARLFYEDGAMPRAVELLRFATEDRPEQHRPWLALFEIYRLERLAGEYAELAGRFRDRHGDTEHWPKVRAFGREIDPGNSLYQEPPMKSLETIGPREAKRMGGASVDPIAENWLEAPMDFENEVLATELRRSLMARAGVDDRDLVPNPMPALRSVEMFSVG